MGLIGYLPLTESIALNIRPKFPIENFWSMLELADNSSGRILPLLRKYDSARGTAPHRLLTQSFCFFLKQILDAGIVRAYSPRSYSGYYQPKMDFGRTISKHLSRGNGAVVEASVFHFTANNEANGILKSACQGFLRLAPREPEWIVERQLLLESLRTLQYVEQRPLLKGYDDEALELPQWLRQGYAGALATYSMLLGHTPLGFSYHADGSALPSFLFSLDDIFERFVRNTLRLAFKDEKIAVLDGNSPKHQEPLFTDNKQFPTKPDLIFRKGGTVLGLGEVKYKPKISEADRYQLISHAVARNAPVGIWISPATGGVSTMNYIGSVSTGAKFFHFRICLEENTNGACQKLATEVRSHLLT